MYDEAQVPCYLIAYGNDRCAKKILTKAKITAEYPAALGVRSVSEEKAEEYYTDCNYEAKIYKYLDVIQEANKNPFPFTNTYKFEGYIEGKIGNQDFNGKLKLKV